jgi:hypothetical protein
MFYGARRIFVVCLNISFPLLLDGHDSLYHKAIEAEVEKDYDD